MLEAICSELAAELGKAFPNLVVEPGRRTRYRHYKINIGFCGINIGSIWLYADALMAIVWVNDVDAVMLKCSYADPEAFDHVQSFISEHYNTFLSSRGLSWC